MLRKTQFTEVILLLPTACLAPPVVDDHSVLQEGTHVIGKPAVFNRKPYR